MKNHHYFYQSTIKLLSFSTENCGKLVYFSMYILLKMIKIFIDYINAPYAIYSILYLDLFHFLLTLFQW